MTGTDAHTGDRRTGETLKSANQFIGYADDHSNSD